MHRGIRETVKGSNRYVTRHLTAEDVFEEIMTGMLFLNPCIHGGM